MNARTLGPLLVALGVLLVLAGLVASAGGLSWFGRLPGDIRLERGNVRLSAPLVSMLVVSLALSAIVWVVRRLF